MMMMMMYSIVKILNLQKSSVATSMLRDLQDSFDKEHSNPFKKSPTFSPPTYNFLKMIQTGIMGTKVSSKSESKKLVTDGHSPAFVGSQSNETATEKGYL